MKPVREIAQNQMFAVAVILNELTEIASKHKKATILIILFEIWVHSLMFQHLGELKTIYELIPFLK